MIGAKVRAPVIPFSIGSILPLSGRLRLCQPLLPWEDRRFFARGVTMVIGRQYLDKIGVVGVDEVKKAFYPGVSCRRISEVLWGIATFALFLLLGAFFVIAAICSVCFVRQGEGIEPEAMFGGERCN